MKCPKCGNEYDDSFKFCNECAEENPTQKAAVPPPAQGASFGKPDGILVAPAAQAEQRFSKEPKGKFSKKAWIIIACAAGVVVVAGIVMGLVLALGGGNSIAGIYNSVDGVKTLELSEDGNAVLTFTFLEDDIAIEGEYVVEGEKVRIWDPTEGTSEEIEGIVFRRTGNNLIHEPDEEMYFKLDEDIEKAAKTANEKSTKSYTPTETTTPTVPTQKDWVEVASFTGSGSQNTGPFNIASSAVRVRWTGTTGEYRKNLIISLCPTSGGKKPSLVSVIVEAGQTMSDETFAYDVAPGSYYLDVVGPNSWTISVDQQ